MFRQILTGIGLFIVVVYRPHSDTPQSVWFLQTNDRPVAETSTWQHATLTTRNTHNTQHSQHSQQTHIQAPVGFQTAVPTRQRPPQNDALDRAAIGIGSYRQERTDKGNLCQQEPK